MTTGEARGEEGREPGAGPSPRSDDLAPEALEPRLGGAVTQPAVPEVAAEPPGGRPSLRSRVTGFRVLVAATIVLGVASVLLGLMVFAPGLAPIKLGATRLAAEAQGNEEIREVARRFATNFLSLDYRTIDEDFEQLLQDTTGNFESQLRRLIDTTRQRLTEAEGVSEGRVTGLVILSRSEETAVVQLEVLRTITNVETTEPQTVAHTLRVSLVETREGWKVDDTTGLPSAGTEDG